MRLKGLLIKQLQNNVEEWVRISDRAFLLHNGCISPCFITGNICEQVERPRRDILYIQWPVSE